MIYSILDPNNFDQVLRCLHAKEVGCMIARVGWLKIFNPMKPEGAVELDIGGHWEELQVAKMLCGLAVREPGDNWISKLS